tara:strand:- start:457 stop:840 length:384 start_codon:yes stop_codon:yes gene_type:complete
MSKKFYDDSHETHTKWVEYLFEQGQDAAAQMAQMAGQEAQAAEQAAQAQAQQAEQEMLALRQGVGGAVGELITIMYQLSQAGKQQTASAAASQMGSLLIKIAKNQTDPARAAKEASGIVQNAASKLR